MADNQDASRPELLAELAEVMSSEELPLGHLLSLAFERLSGLMPLQRAVVFAPQEPDGPWGPVTTAGASALDRDDYRLISSVNSGAAVDRFVSAEHRHGSGGPGTGGAGPWRDIDGAVVIPLRSSGRAVGALVLIDVSPIKLSALAPEIVIGLSLCLAEAIIRESAWRDRLFFQRSTRAIRRLFEEGARARNVEEAGEVLARVAAEAFETERAGMYVTDPDGLISFAVGVGISAELSSALSQSLIGKVAAESPVWQTLEQNAGPSLIDDAETTAQRPGGFVQTLAFRSYVAIPLLSMSGPLGMVICGDASYRRTWSPREEALAKQFALEGALVVDAARLRAAERAQLAEITHQAFHDRLTGLANGALFLDRAQQALAFATRNRTSAAILLIDLNDFKQVNDTLGHHYGDVLLQKVAACLRGMLRETDSVARLGGDEFAILVAGDANLAEARAVAEKLDMQLSMPIDLDGISLQVVPSIGIAVFPEHGRDATALLQHADIAMYAAKRSGGGPAAYHSSQDRSTPDKLTVFTELRTAIGNDELRLHYQPKLDLNTGRLSGVEALLRWQHPRQGLLGPDEFLPVAESTGLIDPLTDWVLTAAVNQWIRWTETDVNLDLSVNVSARNLLNRGFLDRLKELLGHSGIARQLILEITETAVMLDPERTAHTLAEVRSLGVRISMDDFGAGYSSLTQLRQLPLDELKIDRMLVRDVAASDLDAAILETIVGLGHRLGLRVVAEGIEDANTLRVVGSLGCDEAQGFYIGKPTPSAELTKALDAFAETGPLGPTNPK